jgi:hypothetical protein
LRPSLEGPLLEEEKLPRSPPAAYRSAERARSD